jgi:pantoate--beta-alanine ligase
MTGRHPEVVRDLSNLRRRVTDWRLSGRSVGLVPTMGALHEGHLALAEAAGRDCAHVVATIFVNPIQFNSADDLAAYPRREAADLDLLGEAGVDLVYVPDVGAMYPDGFATRVTVGGGLGDCLCGSARPGHMEGVATVVTKLFLRVLPDIAYFGEKDYQQLLIMRRMSRDLDMPLEVRAVETRREPDGLALSSRNFNLTSEARAVAPLLYCVLRESAVAIRDGQPVGTCLQHGIDRLAGAGFSPIDYLELRGGKDLDLLSELQPNARLFAAASLGGVRLIDNIKVS